MQIGTGTSAGYSDTLPFNSAKADYVSALISVPLGIRSSLSPLRKQTQPRLISETRDRMVFLVPTSGLHFGLCNNIPLPLYFIEMEAMHFQKSDIV